jgi:hypothetical protein
MSKLSEVLSKLENNNGIIHGGKAKSKIDTVMGNMKNFYIDGVDNAYIDSFNEDYTKYINDYNNEIQNVSYGNISGIKQKYSNLAQDLKSRANKIKAALNMNTSMSAEDKQAIISSMSGVGSTINSSLSNIKKSVDYYSQWATQEDYDKDMRSVGYYNKYKPYNYDDLMSILGDLPSGEEKDWLASNMSALLSQSEDFTEGVSLGESKTNPHPTDYEDWYARLKEMTASENYDEYSLEDVRKYYKSKPVINDPLTFYFENAVDSDAARQYSPSASGDISSAFYKIVENGDENCWNQITKDERQVYLYTLGTKGTDAAMEYLDSLTPVLQARQDGENARKIDKFLGQYEGFKGFLVNAGITAVLIPMKLFSGVNYINTAADIITGGDGNRYSGANTTGNFINAMQSGIGREFASTSNWEIGGKNVLEQAYYLSTEGVEMAVFGSWMGPFYLALKGMGAAQDTAEDIYARGGNAAQVLIGSLAAGAVEAILEKLPLENLFGKAAKESVDTVGDWFKMIGRQAGTEALEEVGTEIANNLTDNLLMGDKSSIQLRVNELLEENPSMSLDEARKQAVTEKFYDLLWAAAGGAILGGTGGAVFGGKYLATNNAINTHLGVELKKAGADVKGMLDYASNFKANNKLINSILNKSTADNISELNLGRLYSEINAEIESKFKNAKTFDDVKDVYNEIVNQNGGDGVLNIANYQAEKYAKKTSPLYETDTSFIKPIEKVKPNSKGGNNVVGSFDEEKGVDTTTVGSKVAEPTTEQGGEIESTLPNISAQGPDADPVADAAFKARGVERLTDDQKFIKKVGKAFGREVKFKNLDEWRTNENGKKYLFSPNGVYNKNTGEITINSSKNSKGNALAFIFKHELTHFAETAGESFTLFMNEVMDSQAFKDWVKSKGYADGDSVSATMAMNAEYIKRWKLNGKDAEHKANLEMVADFVGENLFAKDLTRLEQAIKQMQPKTVKTFKEWILNILDKLKAAFQSIGKHTEIEALERDFVRICDEAMKNAEKKQAEGEKGQKENSTEGGVEHSLSSMAYTFFGDENMSSVAFEEGDYKQTDGYKNFVEKCVNNMRQTRTDFDEAVARQEIEKQIDGIVRVALAAKKAGYDIADDASKRDVKDSKNRLLFSSLEPNSDYFTSSDISTICDKRKNFAEIYDDIVRAEEEKGVPKGKRFFDNVDNYFYLHDVLAKKGLTQPCRECYVESMRKNLAPMANAFLKLVNETDVNNKANDQLYQQSGKNKGQLKSNNAELRQRVLETFEEHPEYGMSVGDLTVETLTTENGLAQLKIQAPLIYEAFNSFYGQSKPKMPKSATPFRFGELTALLTDNNGKIKQSLVDKINSTGGFRLQSYSDFQIQNYTDVLQVIFEAGTLGLNGHAYTKVPAFLEATEGTNLKRNVSIFMYKDGNEWKLDKNDSFPAESIEEIYNIVKADKSGNTGIIAVSQNKDMSCWIMANDNVAYGIPFHKSGLKMATVRDTNVKTDDERIIKGYSGTIDHTKQQTEVWAKASADHKALTKVKKGINIYSKEVGWDFDNKGNLPKNKLIEKNVKKYIDACERAGYLPKFREYVMNNDAVLTNVLKYAKELGFVSPDATVEDISFKYKGYTIPYGYYKFLGDFSMFTPDGKVSPHEVLSLNNYNFDKAEQFFADAEGLRRNEILQQFANDGERQKYRDSNLTAEELTEIVKQKRKEVVDEIVPQAETDLEAEDMEYSVSPEENEELLRQYEDGEIDVVPIKKIDVKIEAERLEKRFGKYKLGRNALETKIQEILDNSNPTNFLRAMRLAELLANDFENVKQVGYENVLKHLNYTLVNHQLDYLSRSQQSKWERKAERLEKRIAEKDRKIAEKDLRIKELESKEDEGRKYHDKMELERLKREDRKKNLAHFKSTYNRLNTRLRSNSDAKHIPEHLKGVVGSFIDTFRTGLKEVDGEKKQRRLQSKDIARLKTKYQEVEFNANGTPNFAYDESMVEFLDYLFNLAEQKDKGILLSDLNMFDVLELSHLADNLWHMCKMAEEELATGRSEKFSKLISECFADLNNLEDAKEADVALEAINKLVEGAKGITTDNLTPAYFMKRLGPKFYDLYKEVTKGESKWALYAENAKKYVAKQMEKYHYSKWKNDSVEFTTDRGITIKMTVEQAMALYAVMRRQLGNRDQEAQHLNTGGFVLKDAILKDAWNQLQKKLGELKEGDAEGKDKLLKQFYKKYAENPVQLSYQDMYNFDTVLTQEQKAYVEAMTEYLSDQMAALGNEVSMEIFGYKKFGEKNYFPYQTAEYYINTHPGKPKGDERIKHFSFTKSTQFKAGTPLVISSFSETWAGHVDKMCLYNGLTIPLETLNRVYNASIYDDTGKPFEDKNMRTVIAKKFGTEAEKYFKRFIDDMNGGVRANEDGFGNAFLSKYKKVSVAANLSVIVQQPTSLFRAFAVISPKYLANFSDTKGVNKSYEQMCKYVGAAVIKKLGRFDTGVGVSTTKWILGQETLSDKADNLLSAGAEFADKMAWACIWNMSKAKVKDTTDLKVGSQEFFEKAAEIATEIITLTQVYDSTTVKSQHMRDKTLYKKTLTSFMGELTVTYNMLADAAYEAKNNGKKGRKYAVRVISSVMIANITNALLKSLVYALRDDDEEKSYWEKYLKQLGGVSKDAINPLTILTLVPVMRDLVFIWEGYNVDRLDLAAFEDFIAALKPFEEENIDNKDFNVGKALEGLIVSGSALLGIPTSNIIRDVKAISNTLSSAVSPDKNPTTATGIKYAMLEGFENKEGKAFYYQMMAEAAEDGDEETYMEIYDLLLENDFELPKILSGVKSKLKDVDSVEEQTDKYVAELENNSTYEMLDDEDRKKLDSKIREALSLEYLDKMIPGSDAQYDELYKAKRSNSKKFKKLKEDLLNSGISQSQLDVKLFMAEIRYIENKGIDVKDWALAEIAKSKKYADADGSGGVSKKETKQAINNMDTDEKTKKDLWAYYYGK